MPFQLDGNDAKLCNEVPDAQHMFFILNCQFSERLPKAKSDCCF